MEAQAEAVAEKKSPSMKLVKAKKEKTVVDVKTEEVAEVEAVTVAEVAVAEVPDTTEAQTIVADDNDLIVKTVNEVENLKEDKAFKLVPQLINNIDHDYFKLGGVLALIQANGWYMDKGYENFRQYVEAEGGMMYRKAMYLVGIYNGLSSSGVAWDKVKGLGWTMLKELAGILTPENVDEWVDAVKDMTVLQAQEYIKLKSAGVSEGNSAEKAEVEVKKTTTMTFKLHEDQKQTIREALDKNKHESGTDVDTVALENICLDYLSSESKLKKAPSLREAMQGKSLEEVLEALDKVFPNVNITVELPDGE